MRQRLGEVLVVDLCSIHGLNIYIYISSVGLGPSSSKRRIQPWLNALLLEVFELAY